MILEVSKGTALGYCHQCNRASKVVELSLAGWPYRFWMCANCLQELTRCAMVAVPENREGA